MAAPAVSVVIPTYNRRALLAEAVASVLAQTFGDLEVIVADDGSTDATRTYITGLSDRRVRLLAISHTGNVAVVRNAGAREARGRYLAFLDSDDLWLPRKLELQVAALSNSDAGWSYARYDHIDATGRPVPPRAWSWRPISGNVAHAVVAMETTVALCTVLVDRDLFRALGGFDASPALARREDYEFVVRLAVAADGCAIDERLARVRDHVGRSTHGWDGPAPMVAAARCYDAALRATSDRRLRRIARRMRAGCLAEAGARHLRAGQWRDGARCFAGALGAAPARRFASALARGLRARMGATTVRPD